jgi:hypothetical protein
VSRRRDEFPVAARLERLHFGRQLQRLVAQCRRRQRLELFDERIDGLELAGGWRGG